MQCLCPITIRNPKYKFNPKEMQFIKVPCGKCESCLVNRQNSWSVRINNHLDKFPYAWFVTLTYNDFNLSFVEDENGLKRPTLVKDDLHKFFRSFRKRSKRHFFYYGIGEYGTDTFRPHYHFLIGFDRYIKPSILESLILASWQKGFVTIDVINDNRINYVTGYFLSKLTCPENVQKPFSCMSKRIGIGYVDKMKDWHNSDPLNRFYVPDYDKKKPMPRYYKEKIFSKSDIDSFGRKCESMAEKLMQDNIDSMGITKYEHYAHSLRIDTARKIRKSHKKKVL